jgi:electron transfer flavoprotein-quinone oxidoreductase
VLDLPSEVIEERFHLSKGEGAVKNGMGYPIEDTGGAFSLYTNTDSVSLAVFGQVSLLQQNGVKLHERLEILKEHPFINSLIKGASAREYQAHIISDGGRIKLKNLYGNGVLLCGEAGGLVNYFSVGVPPAMLSGLMAAETIELAMKKGDYSARTLKNYVKFLNTTSLPRMISQSRKFSNYLVKKGRKDIPLYRNHAAEAIEGMIVSEADFITKKPYPVVKFLYLKIGQDFVPRILRLPIRLVMQTCSFLVGLFKK